MLVVKRHSHPRKGKAQLCLRQLKGGKNENGSHFANNYGMISSQKKQVKWHMWQAMCGRPRSWSLNDKKLRFILTGHVVQFVY
jgi:hypothetical protein